MYKLKVVGFFLMWWCAAFGALATEPLYDQLAYKDQTGYIFQSDTGLLPLPASEQLQVLQRTEMCSAIGGPRGMYEYDDGRLWITGLYRCSGRVALDHVYPDMQARSLAVWVSGKLTAKLGKIVCTKPYRRWVFETELTMEVERGVVTSLSVKTNDAFACG